jgi:hypothetical protein
MKTSDLSMIIHHLIQQKRRRRMAYKKEEEDLLFFRMHIHDLFLFLVGLVLLQQGISCET